MEERVAPVFLDGLQDGDKETVTAPDNPWSDGLSVDAAIEYYQARSEIEQIQIQIGVLASTPIWCRLSFGFAGLLIIIRCFTFYLHVQAMADRNETKETTAHFATEDEQPGLRVVKKTRATAQRSARPVIMQPVLKSMAMPVVQRSARPAAMRSAPSPPTAATPAQSDVGVIFVPVHNGLEITGLLPGTSAADSDLRVGDIVIIVGEQFTAGVSAQDLVGVLCGTPSSHVEITAKRQDAVGTSAKLYESLLRDSPVRTAEDWAKIWKTIQARPTEKAKGFLAEILGPLMNVVKGPLMNVVRAYADTATGKRSLRSLANSATGVVSAGTTTVLASFSPAVDKIKSAENRRNETAMASKNARKEAGDRQSALQREIEEAMADGVITEEEQMGIDARKAELAAAKKVQDKATAAATSAADEARATLAKAQVEASEMLRKSEEQATDMLKRAQETVQQQTEVNVYVCTCVGVYVHMYVCVYVSAYVYTYSLTHKHTHAHTHMHRAHMNKKKKYTTHRHTHTNKKART